MICPLKTRNDAKIGIRNLASFGGVGGLFLCCVLFCGGCSLLPKKKKPQPAEAAPIRIGEVALVNNSSEFVLVDIGSGIGPRPGQALKTFRDGAETGVLTVSPESKRPFIVGDIVRGEPAAGDEVFQ